MDIGIASRYPTAKINRKMAAPVCADFEHEKSPKIFDQGLHLGASAAKGFGKTSPEVGGQKNGPEVRKTGVNDGSYFQRQMALGGVMIKGSGDEFLEISAARRVMDVLCKLFDNQKLLDVKILTADKPVFAHKLTLMAYSNPLSAALAETLQPVVIDLQGMTSQRVREILKFLYTEDILLNDDNIGDFLRCSLKLDIKILQDICMEYLSHFTTENALLYYVICRHYDANILTSQVWRFICENFEKVVQTESFLMSSSSLVTALLSDDRIQVKSEISVLKAAEFWLDHCLDESHHVVQVLSCIRLPKGSPGLILMCTRIKARLVKFNNARALCYALAQLFTRKNQTGPKGGSFLVILEIALKDAQVQMAERDNPSAELELQSTNNGPSSCEQSLDVKSDSDTELSDDELEDPDVPETVVLAPAPVPGQKISVGNLPVLVMNELDAECTKFNGDQSDPELSDDEPKDGALLVSGGLDAEHIKLEGSLSIPDQLSDDELSGVDIPPASELPAAPEPASEQTSAQVAEPDTKISAGNPSLLVIGGLDMEHIGGKEPGMNITIYDSKQEQWKMADQLTANTHHHTSAVIAGKLYLIGGSVYDADKNSFKSTKDVYVCDLATFEWSAGVPMLEARSSHGCAVHNGKIYVTGGWNTEKLALDTIEQYDPETKSWTLVARMPDGGSLGAAVAVLQDNLYIVGGYNANLSKPVLRTVLRMDMNTFYWQAHKPLRMPCCHATLVCVNDKMYLIGGRAQYRGMISLDSVLRYNAKKQDWIFETQMAEPRHDASVAVSGNKIIIIGGLYSPSHSSKSSLDSIECYDITTHCWTDDIPDLPYGVTGAAVVVLDDSVMT